MAIFPSRNQKNLNRNFFLKPSQETKSDCPEIGHLNPYRQIPETISKKRAVTRGISRKLLAGKFHGYLPMKKYFFPKTGHDSEAFPETFSNI